MLLYVYRSKPPEKPKEAISFKGIYPIHSYCTTPEGMIAMSSDKE